MATTMTADAPPALPAGSHRTLRWSLLAIALVVAGVLTIPWWGRNLAFFRLQRVEVQGTRFARPSDIAARLALDTTTSIWSNLDSVRVRAERHPQVRRARVTRRLPSTLVVTVEENLPVALVPASGGFKAYDESGRALPLDPARFGVDLPVVPRADSALFRLLGEIKAEEPEFFARISEVRRAGRDEVVLQLVDLPVRAMLDLRAERLRQLSSVEADLTRRNLRPVELDLRFKDLVIARLP